MFNVFRFLISRSWSMTQWMPRSRIASLSWICCEENVPFFRPSTFTNSRAIPTANSAPLINNVWIIPYFA